MLSALIVAAWERQAQKQLQLQQQSNYSRKHYQHHSYNNSWNCLKQKSLTW